MPLAAEGVVSLCTLGRSNGGVRLGTENCVVRGVFPSPGGCLRANVNDGTYVRCRSEVPVIVRFR